MNPYEINNMKKGTVYIEIGYINIDDDSLENAIATICEEEGIERTDETPIELVCPSLEEAAHSPTAFRLMIESLKLTDPNILQWRSLFIDIEELSRSLYIEEPARALYAPIAYTLTNEEK